MSREYRTHFGKAVSSVLTADTKLTDVAATIGTSKQHLSQYLNGHRHATAQWADLIADTLKVTDEQRVLLHRAAAKDNGFKLE